GAAGRHSGVSGAWACHDDRRRGGDQPVSHGCSADRRRVSRAVVVTVLLSAWLGPPVLLAPVVAPAAFAVLPSRTLAGALVGRVLPVVFIAGLIVALASLWLDRGG